MFAAEGARIGILDRNRAAAGMTAAAIRAAGGSALAVAADVSKAPEVEAGVAAVAAAFGPITVLFNPAGTIVIKPFLETTEAEGDWLHAVNVKGIS